MSDDINIFDEAKKLSLSEFLEIQLNEKPVRVSNGVRFKTCPDCGPSIKQLRVHVHKDSTWSCFSCGIKGNSIVDAASLLWGCSIVEAAKSLIGIDDSKKVVSIKKRDSQFDHLKDDDPVKKKALHDFLKKLRIALNDVNFKNDNKALEYLSNDRCISLETITEAKKRGLLGLMPSNPKDCLKLITSVATREELEIAGIWKPESKMPAIAFRPLVFFMPGCDSAEFRIIGSPKSDKEPKSIRYGKSSKPYFWTGEENSTRVVVVEGFIDFLSVVDLGWKEHVMGTPGTNAYEIDWFLKCQRVFEPKCFVIAFDNDTGREDGTNPGQESAKSLMEKLDEHALTFINKPPLSGDINDKLIKTKKIALKNVA